MQDLPTHQIQPMPWPYKSPEPIPIENVSGIKRRRYAAQSVRTDPTSLKRRLTEVSPIAFRGIDETTMESLHCRQMWTHTLLTI